MSVKNYKSVRVLKAWYAACKRPVYQVFIVSARASRTRIIPL